MRRPNVICLFRLSSGGSPTHLSIKVVRPELSGWDKFWGKEFRSNSGLYDDQDDKQTLWHELGHALDQVHIKALLGDQKCLVAINADDCYSELNGIAPNIMGRGTGLLPVNAKAWLELIAVLTDFRNSGGAFEHSAQKDSTWSCSCREAFRDFEIGPATSTRPDPGPPQLRRRWENLPA